MKVYRGQIEEFASNHYFPLYYNYEDSTYYADEEKTIRCIFQPKLGAIVHTGANFTTIPAIENHRSAIVANKYYCFEGVSSGILTWSERTEEAAKANATTVVAEIMEWQYNDKDMGERSISAKIAFDERIDFRIGDYVVFQGQTLLRGGNYQGSVDLENFYIYTLVTIEKNARAGSVGDAFIHNVTFYPRQFELGTVMMRDFVQQKANPDQIIYTGFDKVSFYGGAHELLERCMACLRANGYVDNDGQDLWTYDLADAVNEDRNPALERYAFSFDGAYIQDALMKLNAEDFIDTTWYINGRRIYVGYKRPYMCTVNSAGAITNVPLQLKYGKTSHQPIDIDHGGLYKITKSFGKESPITKLYAYGAARNLNRYYDSDRIQSGRYVNNLMLPSFSDDGVTDYIINEEAVARYGIREGKKEFEEIYPSLRYMTYADIRGIKYCIKVRYSGRTDDVWTGDVIEHSNSKSHYPIARIQCYKVVPCDTSNPETKGHNKLVEAAPPEDLIVIVHATGKVVKCRLKGGATDADAIEAQITQDGIVPTTDGVTPAIGGDYSNVYPGSCFAVHDNNLTDSDNQTHTAEEREAWFEYESGVSTENTDAYMHRIEYIDYFWATDVYIFKSYTQRNFQRDGYSLWAWPRLNNDSGYDDSLLVNEVVAVEPVVIEDTSRNADGGRQTTFDIYLRDIGFDIDEQNDFGEMVFVFDSPTISVLDGLMEGREFHIDGNKVNDYTDRICCAIKDDGTLDESSVGFFSPSGYTTSDIPYAAYQNGAIWRLRLTRENVQELESIDVIVPSTTLQMNEGSHIVLLDIYMPDLYIRAAEKRLLAEAQKYLDKASRGNVDYAVEFDKVRIQQIPNYPLQMRAGLNLRLVDADLDISSENKVRKLVEDVIGVRSTVELFTSTQNVQTEVVSNKYKYDIIYPAPAEGEDVVGRYSEFPDPSDNSWIATGGVDRENHRLTVIVPKTNGSSGIQKLEIRLSGMRTNPLGMPYGNISAYECTPTILSSSVVSSNFSVYIEFTEYDFDWINKFDEISFRVVETVTSAESHKFNNAGDEVYAKMDHYTYFVSGKYYEIICDVDSSLVANIQSNDLLKLFGANGRTEHADVFIPADCAVTVVTSDEDVPSGYTRLVFAFDLDSSFNDEHGYYPGVKYIADGETEYGYIYLRSIVEKDIDAEGNVLNYADMIADTVTIHVQENTRPADTRILGSYPEPIREVTATLREKTAASAWTSVMNRIKENEIESNQIKMNYENLANIARFHYRELLMLRDNIFDPDGNCDQTFLHIMMMQVGADSMNYQLDKTYYTIDRVLNDTTGLYEIKQVMHNFSIEKRSGVDHFIVDQDDILRHFVYTAGSQGGTWLVKGGFDCALSSVTETVDGEQVTRWPVYFVSIKCKKDIQNLGNEVQWQCTAKQYAVNDPEDTTCWYFNWGILQPDANGNYSLVETRGNAYMYGDALVAGRIQTLAGNSYFDLTHGNFVLTQGTENDAALSYVNGVLTINGYKSDEMVYNLMERLGLTEIVSIVEKNIFANDGEAYWGSQSTAPLLSLDFPLVKGAKNGKYIIAYDEIESLYRQDPSTTYQDRDKYIKRLKTFTVGIGYYDSTNTYVELVTAASPVENFKQIVTLPIDSDIVMRLNGEIYTSDLSTVQTPIAHAVFTNMVVQYYDYSTYMRHITDALKGSTEIAGGLVLTNLMMLKNADSVVTAGMSGLDDFSSVAGEESAGVTLWAGGTYADALAQAEAFAQGTLQQLQKLLPVLITKRGIGSRIGCFEITSPTSISVKNGNDVVEISTENGIRFIENNVPRIIITNESITNYTNSGTTSTVTLVRNILTSGSFAGILAAGTLNSDKKVIANMRGSKLSFRINGYNDLDAYAYWYNFYLSGKITFTDGNNKIISQTVIGEEEFELSHSTFEPNPESSALAVCDIYGDYPLDNVTQQLAAPGTFMVSCDLKLRLYWKNGWSIKKKEDIYLFDSSKMQSMEIKLWDTGLPTVTSVKPDGMTVIGNDGLIVKSTDTNYVSVKTTYDANRPYIDIKMVGLPVANASGLQTNQIYVDGETLKLKT